MSTFDEQTVYGIVHQVPILQADSVEVLKDLLLENKTRRFLEIGTAIGRTAVLAASLDPEIQVVTIERDPEMIRQARLYIQQSGLEKQITLIEADANEVDLSGQEFDCIFIDAAKSQYIRFFERYSPLLCPSGIIVTDNIDFHGLRAHPERTSNRHTKRLLRHIDEYCEFLDHHPDFSTEYLKSGDGMAITRRRNQMAPEKSV